MVDKLILVESYGFFPAPQVRFFPLADTEERNDTVKQNPSEGSFLVLPLGEHVSQWSSLREVMGPFPIAAGKGTRG